MFNRYARLKLFKTSEKTVPIAPDVRIIPLVLSTILDPMSRKGKLGPKGFRRSNCCFVPELQHIFVSACGGLSCSKRLEHLEHLERLKLAF
jgi:hypothetical protein